MKLTNTFNLPFNFVIGGKGKSENEKSIFDRLFKSSSCSDKSKTDVSSDSEQSLTISGNITGTTTCEINCVELKELFAENKDILNSLANGTYSKAFYEAGKCFGAVFKGISDDVLDYMPELNKKFNVAAESVINMVEKREELDEQRDMKREKREQKKADNLQNEVVILGMKNKIKEDIQKGYYAFTHNDNLEKAKNGDNMAQLYIKLEAEVIKELGDEVKTGDEE